MPNFKDLTGKRFGRLTVIERAENSSHNEVMWFCLCDCGKHITTRSRSLIASETKSCGCLKRDKTIERGHNKAIHGAARAKHNSPSDTKLYSIWLRMKDRCRNPNSSNYKYYGGRGISVCSEWMNDFISFRDWSKSNGYAVGLSIDRIDVNGNYTPENCRWISMEEQQKNKRRSAQAAPRHGIHQGY